VLGDILFYVEKHLISDRGMLPLPDIIIAKRQ